VPEKTFAQTLEGLASGFQKSQILFTALRHGVFALLEHPQSAEDIAQAKGWSPRGARMLLDGLVAIHLVEKDEGRYKNAMIASRCLVPGAPEDQTNILTHKANSYENYGRLYESIASGQPVREPGSKRSSEDQRSFILGMADTARESAELLLKTIDLTPYHYLLDLGGGPGSYSIAFVQGGENRRATVADLPETLPITREIVEAHGATELVDFAEVDLTRDPLPTGHDVMLLSNIIHSFSAEMNAAIIARCFEALEPGGLIIVKDFLLDSGRTGPAWSLIFAIHMLLHTPEGDTFTVDEVAEWTTRAGFAPGWLLEMTPQTRLWLALKPK
jgi:SAM-dependent methyltransferase